MEILNFEPQAIVTKMRAGDLLNAFPRTASTSIIGLAGVSLPVILQLTQLCFVVSFQQAKGFPTLEKNIIQPSYKVASA